MSDTPAPQEAAESGLSSHALFAVALPDTRGRHCYLTDGDGDPPRTYTPELATSFDSVKEAEAAIIEARKTTPFRDRTFLVVPYPLTDEDDEELDPSWDAGLDDDDLHSSANA